MILRAMKQRLTDPAFVCGQCGVQSILVAK